MKRTQQEFENLAKSIVTFHINNSNYVVKTTISHFSKQNIQRQTIYNILKKYKEHGTTKFLPKSGRPSKISDKQVKALVKSVNNKTGISQGPYLNECLRKRLLPFINKHHQNDNILFWPDLASSHYSNQVQQFLQTNNVNYVRRHQNPPNVPQARPIESLWSLLEQKVYEGAWEAKSLDQLAKRIILKAKELDQTMVTRMISGVRGKLLKMYRKGVYSVC
jgi:hypothetical protein